MSSFRATLELGVIEITETAYQNRYIIVNCIMNNKQSEFCIRKICKENKKEICRASYDNIMVVIAYNLYLTPNDIQIYQISSPLT